MWCDCHEYTNQVCDICQGVTGKEKDVDVRLVPEPNCQGCREGYCNGHERQTTTENPKDIIGSDKIPVHLFSAAGVAMGALGKLDGCLKYGRNNFRAASIRYTIYLDALKRHADALLEGEDTDPDSGLHHLCHILATADILAESLAGKTLIDDRNYRGGFWREFIRGLTAHVPRLKAKHADKSPYHYTIKDNE